MADYSILVLKMKRSASIFCANHQQDQMVLMGNKCFIPPVQLRNKITNHKCLAPNFCIIKLRDDSPQPKKIKANILRHRHRFNREMYQDILRGKPVLEIFGCFLRLGSPKTDSTVCVPFVTFERTSGECWRPYNSRRSRAAKNLKQIRSNGIHYYNRFTTGSRCYTGTGISVLMQTGYV